MPPSVHFANSVILITESRDVENPYIITMQLREIKHHEIINWRADERETGGVEGGYWLHCC